MEFMDKGLIVQEMRQVQSSKSIQIQRVRFSILQFQVFPVEVLLLLGMINQEQMAAGMEPMGNVMINTAIPLAPNFR